ncbi:electron transport complex subunit RsxA [Spirochaeta africana]|uniref:Ion-translocating oxidoreductase complex subunit A n=1 Tax=Spirochaeta africana (strain ATCC 700263 / DSM 8902 / Z-7692) TaxID=889378 RepID=H9UGJ4_SPIAZ|nr:electron transport complex subunit RsxA [Spirochaeta africana]AFG36637.1 electron transport complex, RnfABCDGE type, A subunit [Spirochaeta africana DSM 8902]
MNYFSIMVGAILINNIVLVQFLGICPFLGVSNKLTTAIGMSFAVLFVMTLATLATFLIYHSILLPAGLVYLQTVAFILVIASLVQLVEIVMKKSSPALHQALGVFLPLITTNCAILGVALLVIQREYSLTEGLVFAVSSAIGFAIALIVFAGIRERLALADVPKRLRGAPISLITAGLLAMAFMGFAGLF